MGESNGENPMRELVRTKDICSAERNCIYDMALGLATEEQCATGGGLVSDGSTHVPNVEVHSIYVVPRSDCIR